VGLEILVLLCKIILNFVIPFQHLVRSCKLFRINSTNNTLTTSIAVLYNQMDKSTLVILAKNTMIECYFETEFCGITLDLGG